MFEKHPDERRRLTVAFSAGAVGGGVSALFLAWPMALSIGWILAAVTFGFWVWVGVHDLDATATRRVASREDDGRAAAGLILLVASTSSLILVPLDLDRGVTGSTVLQVAFRSAAIVTIAVSWLLVHTVFTLRYAHRYYSRGGGIDFGGDDAPSYRDFAYVGFTVGMTYQVSDTAMTTPEMRRVVLRHALLSYLFGAVIIATAINVIAGLIN
jgi:uncharacterized membrane protein